MRKAIIDRQVKALAEHGLELRVRTTESRAFDGQTIAVHTAIELVALAEAEAARPTVAGTVRVRVAPSI